MQSLAPMGCYNNAAAQQCNLIGCRVSGPWNQAVVCSAKPPGHSTPVCLSLSEAAGGKQQQLLVENNTGSN